MEKVFKNIYKLIPFKKQVFRFVKHFWVPPYSVYKHLHFVGKFYVHINKTSSFYINHHGSEIENDIFWKGITGGWEKISMQLWIQLCKFSDIVIDIGANTGIYALTAKAVKPNAQVYAFEPLSQIFRKLKANNDLNNFNILCIEKAVSDKNGKAIIYETGDDHLSAATMNPETREHGILELETEIETITLDTFIRENQLGKIDLIKIDVETFEPNVLEGYKNYLSVHKPDFLIEVLTDEVGKKLQNIFDGLGYYYFNIDDIKGKIRKVDMITKSDHFNYLIAKSSTAKKINLL